MGPLGELLQRSLTAFLVIIGSMGVAYILLRLSDKFHYAYVERQQSARAEGRPEPEERMFAEWALICFLLLWRWPARLLQSTF